MGSSSRKSPEELAAQKAEEQRIGEAAAREHAARRKVLVNSASGVGSGKYGWGPNHKGSGPEGTPAEYIVYTDKRGDEYINAGDTDHERAYWDERTGTWKSGKYGPPSGAQYWSTDVVAAPSGGGGGGGAPRRAPTSGVVGDVGAVATPGVTTEEVLGTQNYNSMNNFVPTSHTMGNDGQTQHLNPLVAAENWLHQLQPQPTYNLGQYRNPQIGLLEDEQQNSIWGTV